MKPRTSEHCGISISTMDRLKVLTPGGQWQRPIALAILDDHSRLCCHVQWYLSETAEDSGARTLPGDPETRSAPRSLDR